MIACEIDRNHMIFFVTEETEEAAGDQIFDQLVEEEKMRRFYGILEIE